ncbi:hypothetical protein PybrP1_007469 [[Pythium] brassicae (nom. inval.)]|nr:hypothetical protein PybrP1_007469 [[Pythium] brassicae (nom. inval.)]
MEVDDAPARHKAALQPPALPLRRGLLLCGVCWSLFVVWLDPPFALYWLLGNILVGLVAASELTHRSASGSSPAFKRRVLGLALMALVGSTALLSFLREFELDDLEYYEAAQLPLGDGDADSGAAADTSRVHFIRLYNSELGYLKDVETIHRAMNRNATQGGAETTQEAPPVAVQHYVVNTAINAWSSDVLRFNILQQFWDQSDADEKEEIAADEQQQRLRGEQQPRGDSVPTDILCIAETDVVFHEAYFADTLRAYQEKRAAAHENLELAHIQHFWGHHTLEPFNIGVLCTSSRASVRTRLWVRLMRALHAKRYRRLLYLDFLYAFLPDRFVFAWDQHHGCTEYYPHCHYVHFTRPKAVGIENAMRAIAREKEAVP